MKLHSTSHVFIGSQLRAVFSTGGAYRYLLTRDVADLTGAHNATLLFVMLNPSTAGAEEDDPTVRRCVGYAQRWGYSRLEIVNLCAFRATEPSELMRQSDPFGPLNRVYVKEAAARAQTIVCAWGALGRHYKAETLDVLLSLKKFALAYTKEGEPGHPLYLKSDSKLLPWNA